MRVLSLFDGMSCGRIALSRAGIFVSHYYSSEIDKYANIVSEANYPDIIRMGDVTRWREWDIDWSKIDLLIGGSPCQGFSFAGKQLAFDDPRSVLFFVFVDILNHIKSLNPDVKFMLENVKMKREHMDVITDQLGVEPVFINSALVSAQNRQRWYWCNWEVSQPEDRGIMLKDILECDGTGFIKSHGEMKLKHDKSQCLDANYHKGIDNHGQRTVVANPACMVGRKLDENGVRNDFSDVKPIQCLEVHEHGKSRCLSTVAKDTLVSSLPKGRYPVREKSKTIRVGDRSSPPDSKQNWDNALKSKDQYRKLTPIECERLQTIPDNYSNHVSNTQRYKMLGNGWTIEVIAHILKPLKG